MNIHNNLKGHNEEIGQKQYLPEVKNLGNEK